MQNTKFLSGAKAVRRMALAAVLALTLILAAPLCALAVVPQPSTGTQMDSSELSVPFSYTAAISGTKVTVTVRDSSKADGSKEMLDAYGTNYWTTGTFSGNVCTLTLDLAGIGDGIYTMWIWEGNGDGTYWTGIQSFSVTVSGGAPVFYFPGGASEEAVLADLNANYDPKDYNGTPDIYNAYYRRNAESFVQIQQEARNICAGADTAEQKVKAIHDWIATNVAYDWEGYYAGNTSNSGDPLWAYANRRAVCSGYARLARIMYGAVGVPCLNIVGYAAGYGTNGALQAGTDYTASNHEWNAVYLGGSWKILDITWDSQNDYYGAGSAQNDLGNAPRYAYYGIPAKQFSVDHVSMEVCDFRDLPGDPEPDASEEGQTASEAESAEGVPMYRLYNSGSGEHFYTASANERDTLVSWGWKYEGVAWNAPASSNTPVYRLYNPYTSDHHYTTSASERDALAALGWRDEGIGWYSDDSQATPLYRLYNPNARGAGSHHYTTSAVERDSLVAVGWKNEGTGWYGK